MKTNDIGRLFWCDIPLTADAPLVHSAPMRQGRWPFWWAKTLILRYRRGRGLIVGWWRNAPDKSEHELLLLALSGHDLSKRNPAARVAADVE